MALGAQAPDRSGLPSAVRGVGPAGGQAGLVPLGAVSGEDGYNWEPRGAVNAPFGVCAEIEAQSASARSAPEPKDLLEHNACILQIAIQYIFVIEYLSISMRHWLNRLGAGIVRATVRLNACIGTKEIYLWEQPNGTNQSAFKSTGR